ncbi:RrF2 family transcriptional regulator [Nitratidesulfovibrio liaohensis]|uniref:RrF2 family transcriptional regulator n=1 Tax=Nitratidesulfovibrio liaohensis TaxID=2604158 RepID=UPI00141F8B81|nr:Rrf2 family transcriptional regulator [Nitratidesulfovibrio liaohensis]NHZ47218.1 Rrf2 family transcriptional regulator [Nitratidesulfovibrio liaohensis]
MKLTARTRYAARVLVALAVHGTEGPLTTTALSRHTDISVQFLEQILKDLRRAGLTASARGAMGGHRLALPPARISLGTVVRLMEGGIRIAEHCALPATPGDRLTCLGWTRAADAVESALDSITLDDLAKGLPDLTDPDPTHDGTALADRPDA